MDAIIHKCHWCNNKCAPCVAGKQCRAVLHFCRETCRAAYMEDVERNGKISPGRKHVTAADPPTLG